MATEAELQAMHRAIEVARSVPRTLPNPRVGCVLLDPDGREIAVGVHRGAGTPHAEADALAQAGVARVVHAETDPNPAAAGGAGTLQAAGVDVESGVLADEAAALNVEWTFAVTHGRPFVTWKYAATLDGLSAAPDGSSKWITSAEARRDVQTFRAEADAIMAGTGSVLTDDPRLTVRDEDDLPLPYEQQPLRVVVGGSQIPSYYRVWDRTAPTLLVQTRDPEVALAKLVEHEIQHVWLEGGPRLAGRFWNAGLIDRVVGYIAPSMLGSGRAALEGEATTLADLRPIDLQDLRTVGPDIRIVGTPGRAAREEMP